MERSKEKQWEIKERADIKLTEEISKCTGTNAIVSQILINRGFSSAKDALNFINKSDSVLHDPFLMNGMDTACKRILEAIDKNEKITVYGDYDVDGITSVSILYMFLYRIGAENIEYYIPSRQSEGYGISCGAIEKLSQNGTRLIITVDTGITACKEVEYAKELNIDVIITDHHECTEILPDAVAVINPKRLDSTYPFPYLAGVGVAFKFICAIENTRNKESMLESVKRVAYLYSDLVAIGTIADVMPLVDENRIIVSYGLSKIENTENIGLRSLIELCRNNENKQSKPKADKKITAGFVGFSIAPRINAAGRISTASIAVEMFLAKDEKTSKAYAVKLCDINKERQIEENRIADEAYTEIENIEKENKVIVLENNTWNHGVIGIVSSRITEKYALPSILVSFEGNEDPNSPEAIGKGSGRSIKGMNLVKALASCSDLLEKFGGHELAAGLSVKRKNLEEFKNRINMYAEECFENISSTPVLSIDYEMNCDEINISTIKSIEKLEPYGVANPMPVFVLRNVRLDDISPVGMNRHLRLVISKGEFSFPAMQFSSSLEEFSYHINDEVDIAFTLDINDFMGIKKPQINIKDIHLSQNMLEKEKIGEEMYQAAKNGVCELEYDEIVPVREDFAAVYTFLQRSARDGNEIYSAVKLLSDISHYSESRNCKISYVKLKFIIKIFRELNIFNITEISDTEFNFKCVYTKTKTNLEKSNILKKIRSMYSNKQNQSK